MKIGPLLVILVCCTTVPPVIGWTESAPAAAENGGFIEKSGVVESVDLSSLTLTLRVYQSGNESIFSRESYHVQDDAQIVRGRDTISLKDLKQGDRITLKYSVSSEGRSEVFLIVVESKE